MLIVKSGSKEVQMKSNAQISLTRKHVTAIVCEITSAKIQVG